jgi:mannitol-1-phosphate 5-dehydrogenase
MRSLDVIVETYGSIILDDSTLLRPLESSEIVSYKDYENEFYKKLWLLNGLHLQLAYFGLSNENLYIHEVIASTKGKEFAEKAVKNLSEAYSIFSKTDEVLDEFCRTIINRFALPDINDEVVRIARNPEIKFAKNERFEYPLRLLIRNSSEIDTFRTVFDIIINEDFQQVDGFTSFKRAVLTKGKTHIYNEFWEIQNNSNNYIERLGS